MLRMEEEGDLIFNMHSIFGIRLATAWLWDQL